MWLGIGYKVWSQDAIGGEGGPGPDTAGGDTGVDFVGGMEAGLVKVMTAGGDLEVAGNWV